MKNKTKLKVNYVRECGNNHVEYKQMAGYRVKTKTQI